MEIKEAIEILRQHNIWRRYNGPIGEGPKMIEPRAIGEAIDTVVEFCDSLTIRKFTPLDWWMCSDGQQFMMTAQFDDPIQYPCELYIKKGTEKP